VIFALVAGFFMRGTIDQMRFRKLRIAWSVAWGLMAVLLIALWARSYTWGDRVWGRFSDATGFVLSSYEGRIQLFLERNLGIFPWRIVYAEPVDRIGPRNYFPAIEFPLSRFASFWAVPYWLLLAVFSTLAAVPRLRWRFTLRTLLIATTLVAVVLGLAVYAARG
jgi:hypothetical protein